MDHKFRGFVFVGDIHFEKIPGRAVLRNGDFSHTEFQGHCYFLGTVFQRNASLEGATFHGDSYFNQTIFQGDAKLEETMFYGEANDLPPLIVPLVKSESTE